MAVLKIITEPDPLLRQTSTPVERIDDDLKQLMQNMLDTLYHENGSGIAAIQVGRLVRAFIVDMKRGLEDGEVKEPLFIINPKVNYLSEEKIVLPEACLSVMQNNEINLIRAEVERPLSISIEYTNLNGENQKLEVIGSKSEYDKWVARCIQHELDHLDGILFIDKLYNPIHGEILEVRGNSLWK